MRLKLPQIPPQIIEAGTGRILEAFGSEMTILLGAEQTAGAFTCFIENTPPGGGPPPHFHEREDEWFYPLEGSVEFFLNDQWQAVPLHTLVFIPKGTVHAFRNSGENRLRMLIHTAPAGFEIFFARCAELFSIQQKPDFEVLLAIAKEHGIHFVES